MSTPDELFESRSTPSQQKITLEADPSENNKNNKTACSQQLQTASIPFRVKDQSSCGCKRTKTNHRDFERERRQEMANLYGSLRSILPSQYLKGKRSTSDHIQQAVNYIKHLENKIQELNRRKEKLRKLSDSSSSDSEDLILESSERDALTVNPCFVGVEVVADASLRRSLPLSQVLRVLIEEGLSIVSCSSAKVNERMLHIIQSEASRGRCIDVSALKLKLSDSMIRPVNWNFR